MGLFPSEHNHTRTGSGAYGGIFLPRNPATAPAQGHAPGIPRHIDYQRSIHCRTFRLLQLRRHIRMFGRTRLSIPVFIVFVGPGCVSFRIEFVEHTDDVLDCRHGIRRRRRDISDTVVVGTDKRRNDTAGDADHAQCIIYGTPQRTCYTP